MKAQSLINYVNDLQNVWKKNEGVISKSERVLHLMSHDPSILKLVEDELSTQNLKELYRDEYFGFVLTVYSEAYGQYRNPHNHGDGWVIYEVMKGTMEMGSYSEKSDGEIEVHSLVRLHGGDSTLYLKGDIHDTRCMSDKVIILRFTSCDLKVEEKAGRMKRFSPAEINVL